jgi:hypothetical protein
MSETSKIKPTEQMVETVTFKKEMIDGVEVEYFAHGAREVEGRQIVLINGKPIFINAHDLGLIDKLGQLPFEDIMKLLHFSASDITAYLDSQQRVLNSALHKVVMHNFIWHETGEALDKKLLFKEWGFHSYPNTVRNLKNGTLHIDLVNMLIKNLTAEEVYVSKNGEELFVKDLISDTIKKEAEND